MTLPTLREQADRLIELGISDIAGLTAGHLRSRHERLPNKALLAIHPDSSRRRHRRQCCVLEDKHAFLVADMADVDEFTAIESAVLPDAPLYLVHDLDRGDAMANWSPDEALPAITAAGRTPLTLTEGLSLATAAARNAAAESLLHDDRFATRKPAARRTADTGALDQQRHRTRRSGQAQRPKIGWCWAVIRTPGWVRVGREPANPLRRVDLAAPVGADHAVPSDDHAVAAIRDLTDGHGADVVLDFVGADATMRLARAAARTLGDATIVGTAGGTVPFSFFSQSYEVSIQTTYYGSRTELAELLDLAARGLVHAESTTYSLDDAAQAYRDLHDGKVRGRAVVVP